MKSVAFLVVLTIAGCGPLSLPMVARPDATKQKKIDEAWDRALSPVDKLTRQEWLDLFVGANAYQAGVDKLHMRSEKNFKGGLVVMEVRYDRSRPQEDVFEVQVFDKGKALLRTERFSRDDVKSTVEGLFPGKDRPADKEERKAFDKKYNARWEKILSYFPDAKRDNPAGD